MPTSFHRRIRRILEEAVRLPSTSREAFLQRACAGNPELLLEVRSLLPHYEVMRDFEPERPHGSAWRLPGTTAFTKAKVEADKAQADTAERKPPFAIDQYTVLEMLGRGGMGVVYRAVHPTLHRQVAIKILRKGLVTPENRQRFTFEEEILRQLQHPGIARFVHAGVARIMPLDSAEAMSDWRPYFVMEYIAGQSLTKFAAGNRLGVRERLELFVKICDAVEYAHHRGIIHRDLKPDNILVQPSGQPKVLDFGIAYIPFLQSMLVRDKDGCFTGTLSYASPEQIAGRIDKLTPRSDAYALGLVLHELLTGRLPQRAGGALRMNVDDVCIDGDACLRPRDAEFRYYLTAILATALRMTEGEYYNSAGELGADLENVLTHFPASSRWSVLRSHLSRLFSARSKWAPAPTSRPLRAVLRKRISMAMESDAYRTVAAEEPPEVAPSNANLGTTQRLESGHADRPA